MIKMFLAIGFVLVSSFVSANTNELLKDEYLLTHLPGQLAFRINRDFLFKPGFDKLAFQDRGSLFTSGNCLFFYCPASDRSQTVYPYPADFGNITQNVYRYFRFYGCEIHLKQAYSEPRPLTAGTTLVSTRRESRSLTVYGCPSNAPKNRQCGNSSSETFNIETVTYYIDSDTINFIRCGIADNQPRSKNRVYNSLTKGFLKEQMGSGVIDIFGPSMEPIR